MTALLELQMLIRVQKDSLEDLEERAEDKKRHIEESKGTWSEEVNRVTLGYIQGKIDTTKGIIAQLENLERVMEMN